MIPGEYILRKEAVQCNEGRDVNNVTVMNTGDRPIQVGSHFHFFEVNEKIYFNREDAFGRRLNIASGTAIRFEPGEEKEIELIRFGGSGIVIGFNDYVNGTTDPGNDLQRAMENHSFPEFKNVSFPAFKNLKR